MAETEIEKREYLDCCDAPLDKSDNYKKILRFGDTELVAEVRGYNDEIKKRIENQRCERIYGNATKAMKSANSEESFKVVADIFKTIKGYKDADSLTEQCIENAEICRKNVVYESAISEMINDDVDSYYEAVKIFRTIPGWKDSDNQILACKKRIDKLKEKEEADRLEAEARRLAAENTKKKREKVIAITIPIVAVCIGLVLLLTVKVIIPKQKYNKAITMLDSGDYDSAYALLEEIGKDETIALNKYDRAMKLIDSRDYDSAYALLEESGNDEAISLNKYDRAMKLIDSCDYDSAYALLEENGNDEAISLNKYDRAMKLIDSCDYDSAYALLEEIGNDEAIAKSKYNRAINYIEINDYESAYILLDGLEYIDSNERMQSIKMQYQQMQLKKARVGDTVIWGSYEQDNDTSNGKEDIEWIVLKKRETGQILVISKYALDCQPYHLSDVSTTTWDKCSLRTWLNEEFFSNAFSTEEQDRIIVTSVCTEINPRYSIDTGKETNDKVFIPSITEVERYKYSLHDNLMCVATDYAKAQGAYTSYVNETVQGEPTCCWWLRSLGSSQKHAADVGADGYVRYIGKSVSQNDIGVRPAIWIGDERINEWLDKFVYDVDCLKPTIEGATDISIKVAYKRVSSTVRDTDPLYNDALIEIEEQITLKFNEFSNVVTNRKLNNIEYVTDELIQLIDDRNKQCKVLRGALDD